MRTPSCLLLLGLCVLRVVAAHPAEPTAVDRLVERLSDLAHPRITDWRYTPCLPAGLTPADLARPDFDASAWQPLAYNQRLDAETVWMRGQITLPDRILGRPVRGPLRLRITVDDYGYLWVNGAERGRFDWDGDFLLTEAAQPGTTYTIVVRAHNTGGPLRLLRADLVLDAVRDTARAIDDFLLGLRVAQKLLSTDTYQSTGRLRVDPGIDRSRMDPAEKRRLYDRLQGLARNVDVAALERGDVDRFQASLARVRRGLAPIRAFVRRFTLYMVGNAHIDAAWLWRERETVEVCRNTFRGVLDLMDRYPDLTYAQSSAVYYRWMEQRDPDLFARIRERVREGRWEIVNGMWVEPDCNLPDGESFARHFLYAQHYFQARFGHPARVGWNPDSFGYNVNLPQFLRNAGMHYFVTQKINWNDTNVFPYRLFWWQAPDGSRVLTLFPFSYVNTLRDPFRMVDWLRQFEANTGLTRLLVLFGLGDHGGGPTPEIMERLERLRHLDLFPRIEFGTVAAYFRWLEQQDLDDLPVWTDELYLEYHRGTYTTQARIKAWNRRLETLLTSAEKAAFLAHLAGTASPRPEDFFEAWRNVLFNQFHDILPGSGIHAIYRDAEDRYRQARDIGARLQQTSLRALARRVDTRWARGRPLLVFNPLNFARTDVVTIDLPPGDAGPYAVFDDTGRALPVQMVTVSPTRHQVLFIARAVPGLGYRVYDLRRMEPQTFTSPLRIRETELENEFFRVRVDPETGWIQSIWDKRHNREVLAGPGNELQAREDRPDAWDAWNIGRSGTRYPLRRAGIEMVERGPVRVVLRVRHTLRRPGTRGAFPTETFPTSFFDQDIILYAGLDRIEFRTVADWWEDHTLLKVAFPVAVATDRAVFEIPYGTIPRPTRAKTSWDQAKWEVPALRWVDLSDGAYGVALLNRNKYGHDVKDHVLRLTLLRAPKWPDPLADRGRHVIEYALYPHRGDHRAARLAHVGYAYNTPLVPVWTDRHGGPWPPRRRLVWLVPDRRILTAIKPAEQGTDWIFRFYDPYGESGTTRLVVTRPVERAWMTDFLEQARTELKVAGRTVRVPVAAHQVVTVRVRLGTDTWERD